MKKVSWMIFIVLFSVSIVHGQKSSILLFGTISFISQNGERQTFGVSPGIGYAISDRWTLGIEPDYISTKDQEKSYGIGPFVRYTIPLSDLFSFYSQLEAIYLHTDYLGQQPGVSGYFGGLTPALEMKIHKGWALNFSVGNISYNHINGTASQKAYNAFYFNLGSGVAFGVSKRFGNIKK